MRENFFQQLAMRGLASGAWARLFPVSQMVPFQNFFADVRLGPGQSSGQMQHPPFGRDRKTKSRHMKKEEGVKGGRGDTSPPTTTLSPKSKPRQTTHQYHCSGFSSFPLRAAAPSHPLTCHRPQNNFMSLVSNATDCT